MVNYLVMVLLTTRLFFTRKDAVMAYFKHCSITKGLDYQVLTRLACWMCPCLWPQSSDQTLAHNML